ncbi:hypothetical protein ABNG02_15930 [Halorubrum ejinorense]|uniref:Methanogenesis regulatory protein FilR1 middle domain-containing protein n=1 Tax=Halorubrum ejinorense TaxID=425309 RepID=A0AAV3SS24_9EURY
MTDDTRSPAAALRSLVASAVDADLAALDGQTEVVERANETASGDAVAPVDADLTERLAEVVGDAEAVVAVVPRLDAGLARRLSGVVEAADGDGDAPRDLRVVFTDAASDRLSGPAGPVVRRLLVERGIEAYRHDGESPVTVALADDRAVVGLVDGDGIAALLWSDAPAVREWAAATCGRYLDAAEPVGDD